MTSLIRDTELEQQLIAQRQAFGGDRYDEVWEGIYVMSPLANNEHQKIVANLTSIYFEVIGSNGEVFPGVNVSDREDWNSNFRVPDVAVFLNDTKALNRDTFWLGAPDLVVEVVSKNDQSYDKIPFYAENGTRELLIIDRHPWKLQLHRFADNGAKVTMTEVGGPILESEIAPLSYQLVVSDDRTRIEVKHRSADRIWTI